MQQRQFPQDIQCVFPPNSIRGAIFISNLPAALNTATLKKHSIEAVVSVAKGAFLPHSQQDLPYYLYIQAHDRKDFDLSTYFDKTFDFIEKYRKRTNVLVHCMAGVSRSATVVIAYLMRKTGRSLVDCFCDVRKYRPVISPNEGFIRQLKEYQEQLRTERQTRHRQKTEPVERPIKQYLQTQIRRPADYYLNKSADMGRRIEAIDLKAKLSSLRLKYAKNPEKQEQNKSDKQANQEYFNPKRVESKRRRAVKLQHVSY